MNSIRYKVISIIYFYLPLILFALSCKSKQLPILGQPIELDGKLSYPQTPDFTFKNQYGDLISRNTLKGKIHIANFFFTSCATICPKTIRSMIKIANHFKGNTDIIFINFSIDYKKDSVERLKTYYDRLQIDLAAFYLVHVPEMAEVKRITENYMSIAVEDPTAQGGFDHSGWILLSDKNGYLRSFCLGTDENDVDRFIKDIETLLDER